MTTQLPSPRTGLYGPEDFVAEFQISRETLARMETYAQLLAQWQKAVNLVAPSTVGDIWRRHFADSAQVLALAPRNPSAWLDLGSGAGFPGLVVAILLAEPRPTPDPGGSAAAASSPGGAPTPLRSAGQGPELTRVPALTPRVTLVESDQRKAAFLREVARQTGLTVDILAIRIENFATRFKLHPGGIVSARALAPLTELLRMSAPFLSEGSVGLFLKGRDAEAEVAEAAKVWRFDWELVASRTDPDARIVVVRNLAGTFAEPKTKLGRIQKGD